MSKAPSLYPTTRTGASVPSDVTGTICTGDKFAMDVSVQGGQIGVVPSGLSVGGKITEVTLNSTTWTALPAVPLANRNAVGIQNRSGIEVKMNYDNTVVGYVGVVIPDSGERFYDITGAIILYAKSVSGTPKVIVEEIA